MPLPTTYPGNLTQTSGDLTIFPRFPSTEEVVLVNNQIVIGTAFAEEVTPVSLDDGFDHVVVSLTVDARQVDSIVTVQGLASLLPSASGTASPIVKGFLVNTVPTTLVNDFCPSEVATGGASVGIAAMAQSGIIAAGTPIVVEFVLQATAIGNEITTEVATLLVSVGPGPVIIP